MTTTTRQWGHGQALLFPYSFVGATTIAVATTEGVEMVEMKRSGGMVVKGNSRHSR